MARIIPPPPKPEPYWLHGKPPAAGAVAFLIVALVATVLFCTFAYFYQAVR